MKNIEKTLYEDSLTQFQQEFNGFQEKVPNQSFQKNQNSNSFHSYRENRNNKEEEEKGKKSIKEESWREEKNRMREDENGRREEENRRREEENGRKEKGRREEGRRMERENREEQEEEGEGREGEGREEDDADFENFKKNYFNFYRGYTPNENSMRNYSSAIQILKAYENIKDELYNIKKEKEQAMLK